MTYTVLQSARAGALDRASPGTSARLVQQQNQLLGRIQDMAKRSSPVSIVSADALPTLRNSSRRGTVLGVHDCYPAMAAHQVNILRQNKQPDGLTTEMHQGQSLQGSISLPNLLPGVGFVTPLLDVESSANAVVHRSDAVDFAAEHLTTDGVSQLLPGDRICVQTDSLRSGGLYGSTSSGIPGLSTPAILAHALTNSVLLPCVLFAAGAGALLSKVEHQEFVLEKQEQGCRVTASTADSQIQDRTLGLKTVCWLMWLASLAIEGVKMLRVSDQAPTNELKQKPVLWHNLSIGVSINWQAKTTESQHMTQDISNDEIGSKQGLDQFLHDLQQDVALFPENKARHKRALGHGYQTEEKVGVGAHFLSLFQWEQATKTTEAQTSRFDTDGSFSQITSRDVRHFSKTDIQGHTRHYKDVQNNESVSQWVHEGGDLKTQLQNTIRLNEHFLVQANHRASHQKIEGYLDLAKSLGEHSVIKGDIDKLRKASTAPVRVKASLSFSTKGLSKGLEQFSNARERQPALFAQQLARGALYCQKGTASFLQDWAKSDLEKMIIKLEKSAQGEHLGVELQRMLQGPDHDNMGRALAVCLAPFVPSSETSGIMFSLTMEGSSLELKD